ncbi:hypothetical protein Hypma_001445 [Hypsizygus marmoreus]|uniref:Uncharacterized protein n=1 Tax=Hypsizygus marmoreus TaxID=39966 RepID=A0A369K8G1_HYPMA|nr:hypothetical protein Hypma_001445 [Hypsizygus marmoreus]
MIIETSQLLISLPGNWGRLAYAAILTLFALYASHGPLNVTSQGPALLRSAFRIFSLKAAPPSPRLPLPPIAGNVPTVPILSAAIFAGLIGIGIVCALFWFMRVSTGRFSFHSVTRTPQPAKCFLPEPEGPSPSMCSSLPLLQMPEPREFPPDPPPSSQYLVVWALLPNRLPRRFELPTPPLPPSPDDGPGSMASLPVRRSRASWPRWIMWMNISLTIVSVIYHIHFAHRNPASTPDTFIPSLVSVLTIVILETFVFTTSWVWWMTKRVVCIIFRMPFRMVLRGGYIIIWFRNATSRDIVKAMCASLIVTTLLLKIPRILVEDVLLVVLYLLIKGLEKLGEWIKASVCFLIEPMLPILYAWVTNQIKSPDLWAIFVAVGPALIVRLYVFMESSSKSDHHNEGHFDCNSSEDYAVPQDNNRPRSLGSGILLDDCLCDSGCGFVWPWLLCFLMTSIRILDVGLVDPGTYLSGMKIMPPAIAVILAVKVFMIIVFLPWKVAYTTWRGLKYIEANAYVAVIALCSLLALDLFFYTSQGLGNNIDLGRLQGLDVVLAAIFLPLPPLIFEAGIVLWYYAVDYIMGLDITTRVLVFGPTVALKSYQVLALLRQWRR